MKQYTTSIITKVLNQDTGELEPQRFIQDVSYKKTIKQGWNIMYARDYDEVVFAMCSQLESKLMVDIRNKFSKSNPVANINQRVLAKKHDTTPATVNRLVKKLERLTFIKKVDRGIYRLNPFIYLPYQADGVSLQDDWRALNP